MAVIFFMILWNRWEEIPDSGLKINSQDFRSFQVGSWLRKKSGLVDQAPGPTGGWRKVKAGDESKKRTLTA
jgi:hypothetical protein